MERRAAIKNVGLGLGTILTLPSWVSGWSFSENEFIPSINSNFYAALVEVIIPESDVPGAKAVGAHKFVDRMINDCFDKETKLIMKKGIFAINQIAKQNTGKDFVKLSADERLSLFSKFKDSKEKFKTTFYNLTKQLTIQAYVNSEYYLKNIDQYQMAPAYFHGCVPA